MEHVFRSAEKTQRELEEAFLPASVLVTRKEHHRLVEVVEGNDELIRTGHAPQVPQTERFSLPQVQHSGTQSPPFRETEVCVANCDSVTAGLCLEGSLVLNFANAYTPGGGYLRGARAQEEDLCRLLPQLYYSLKESKDRYGYYHIHSNEALLTKDLLCMRKVGSYNLVNLEKEEAGKVNIVTAAMPVWNENRFGRSWDNQVEMRIRTVLHVARHNTFTKLVLGAWGCGAFGNPPNRVAEHFRKQLSSPEFRGFFEQIVFAIIDPGNDGNLPPFRGMVDQLVEQVAEEDYEPECGCDPVRL